MTNVNNILKNYSFLENLIRKIFFIIVLIALASLFLGYSEHANSATLAGSCNNAKMGFCNEFTGSSYTAATVQRMCGGQFLPNICPAAERVGTCLVYKGKDSESNYVYYKNFPGMRLRGGATVETEAAKQCKELKGEWHPH